MAAKSPTKRKTRTKKSPQSAKPVSMTGAQIVIDALEKEGVEVIFGFPGGRDYRRVRSSQPDG